MDNELKSAREIAREKIDGLGEATEEERLRWKCKPEGEKLASKYLEDKCDLSAELKRHEEKEKAYILEGVESVLLAGIGLPQNEQSKSRNEKAMDGLKIIKKDKAALEDVLGRINNIFGHFSGQGEQQREQARESLKAEYDAKLKQALGQQEGAAAGAEINVENLPQFQEEWRRISANMDMQYISLLEEFKKEIRDIK